MDQDITNKKMCHKPWMRLFISWRVTVSRIFPRKQTMLDRNKQRTSFLLRKAACGLINEEEEEDEDYDEEEEDDDDDDDDDNDNDDNNNDY